MKKPNQIINGEKRIYGFYGLRSPTIGDLPAKEFIYILAYYQAPGYFNMDKIEYVSLPTNEFLKKDIEKSQGQLFFYYELKSGEDYIDVINDIKYGNPLHKIGKAEV
tara:strand:- start:4048 stop:4368 length:321 start_codon:yes stop_codon:yes gene_type:complete